MFNLFGVEITKKHLINAAIVVAGLVLLAFLFFGLEGLIAALTMAGGSAAIAARGSKADKRVEEREDEIDRTVTDIDRAIKDVEDAGEGVDRILGDFKDEVKRNEKEVRNMSDDALEDEFKGRFGGGE